MGRINGCIGEEQAVFRKDHSTIDYIFTLFAAIQYYLLHNRKLYNNDNNNNETLVKLEPPAQNQSSALYTENN